MLRSWLKIRAQDSLVKSFEILRRIKNGSKIFEILPKFSERGYFFEVPFTTPLWLNWQFPRYFVTLFQNESLCRNLKMSLSENER